MANATLDERKSMMKGKKGMERCMKSDMLEQMLGEEYAQPWCLDAFYDQYDDNWEKQTWAAMMQWWHIQPWLAMFAPMYAMKASMYMWIALIFPDSYPNLRNAPWMDMEDAPLTTMWNMWWIWTS